MHFRAMIDGLRQSVVTGNPPPLVYQAWDQVDGELPAVRTVYMANNFARLARGVWLRMPQGGVLDRLRVSDPDTYDHVIAKRYRKSYYLSYGVLSWIPGIASQIDKARIDECIDALRQYAQVIGEEGEAFVPVPKKPRYNLASCFRACLGRFMPDTTAVWRRREFARLEMLVRTSKVVLNYTRAQLGTLEYNGPLERKSLRVALGQAVRTLEGKGEIKVRVSQYPFVVDCCMFLIDPSARIPPNLCK